MILGESCIGDTQTNVFAIVFIWSRMSCPRRAVGFDS